MVPQESLRGLHLLPTVDCLALSPDPAIKARAAATMAALLKAGQIESQEAQARWRDLLITWLVASTASMLDSTAGASTRSSSAAAAADHSKSSSDSSTVGSNHAAGSSDSSSSSWSVFSWFSSGKDSHGSSGSSREGCGLDPADAALARSCVAALAGTYLPVRFRVAG